MINDYDHCNSHTGYLFHNHEFPKTFPFYSSDYYPFINNILYSMHIFYSTTTKNFLIFIKLKWYLKIIINLALTHCRSQYLIINQLRYHSKHIKIARLPGKLWKRKLKPPGVDRPLDSAKVSLLSIPRSTKFLQHAIHQDHILKIYFNKKI